MINLSKKLIFLMNDKKLYNHVVAALELILKIFADNNKNFKTALHKLASIFLKQDENDTTEFLSDCLEYVAYNKATNHHTYYRIERTYFSSLTKTDKGPAKTIIRLIFVYLHKQKSIVLPHNFTRPQGSITRLPESQKLFYAETIHPFLDLETNSNHNPGDGKRIYTDTQRLWQTGIKSTLMSSFFSPEDINAADVQALRFAQLKDRRHNILPIPTTQIFETLCMRFPSRIPQEVKDWVEHSLTAGNSIRVQLGTCEEFLVDILNRHNSPIEIIRNLTQTGKYGVSSFSTDNLHNYRLDSHIHQGWEIFSTAMRVWLTAQQAYLDHKKFEKPKKIRSVFGKTNLYLFVYLPLWILQNPLSKFKYPDTPAKFTASVHYDCQADITEDRPLSLCELFRAMGYKESYGSQTDFRSFFSYLIEFGNDLEGCFGVKQAVRKLPKSKKYINVTKNVFTGEQLRQFIAYHNSINEPSDYFSEQSDQIKSVIDEARKNNTFVDTNDLGFVPVMYHDGKFSPIRRLHPDTFFFVEHDYHFHYHPGSIRFSLFMLECGVRGQTLQWLDANTYDRVSHRLSKDSLQLTSLWLNTDKIQKMPLIILTTMGNLMLLDDQRRWRQYMIDDINVSGFTKKVYYDHEPKSHWGKILPLFVANPVTGDPFTDGQYTTLWNSHCLNFQIWFKENTQETKPIIGYLPLRKSPENSYFTWEEWTNKINPADVLVIEGSDSNRIYQGDYCPIALRAFATPHAARASFITDMSTNLPPEAVALLTGQSLSTIIRYNKGHHLILNKLQGAFNNKDASWYLTNPFNPSFSMMDARDNIEDAVRQGHLPKVVDKLGLNSFPTSSSPREMTGTKLIATDRSLRLGACYTHICPYNFICPESILIKFGGQKRCSQCPFAVFSTHNLPAIEAHRQKLAEDYLSTVEIVLQHSASKEVSTAEVSRLQEEVKSAAKDVMSWMWVEEFLWAKIEMQQHGDEDSQDRDLVVTDGEAVLNQLSRSEYKLDSVEGFLSRLNSACTHPESLSRSFEYKIDRATRLLMINDGKTLEAATMPSSFPSAVKLAGMLRSTLEFKDIDLDQFVRLINLEDKQWTQALLSYRPSKDSDSET
ncbi:hypothetical protein [Pseudomonas asiatica]|uniref:hypothetical protein n=1 Tax=Pseudomonas asiatica TaxID=2219225 RepID=UPI0034594360